MRWKLWGPIAAVGLLVLLSVPFLTIHIKVDLPPTTAPVAKPCASMRLRVGAGLDHPGLILNGAPTTAGRLFSDLARAQRCSARLTAIVIEADPALKYSEFKRLEAQLRAYGYIKIYLEPLRPPRPSS